MVVIYVEKSSLAKEIAKALGAGQRHSLKDEPTIGYYEFEWNGENAVICHGVGHLAQLLPAKAYDEKYAKWDLSVFPCIPDTYKIAAKAQTKACMSLVKSFFDKADWLVNATDPDREGELIFSYVKEVCKCSAPVKRVWIEDLTAQKIQYASTTTNTSAAEPTTLTVTTELTTSTTSMTATTAEETASGTTTATIVEETTSVTSTIPVTETSASDATTAAITEETASETTAATTTEATAYETSATTSKITLAITEESTSEKTTVNSEGTTSNTTTASTTEGTSSNPTEVPTKEVTSEATSATTTEKPASNTTIVTTTDDTTYVTTDTTTVPERLNDTSTFETTTMSEASTSVTEATITEETISEAVESCEETTEIVSELAENSSASISETSTIVTLTTEPTTLVTETMASDTSVQKSTSTSTESVEAATETSAPTLPETRPSIEMIVNEEAPQKAEAAFIPQENINERGELSFKHSNGMSITFDQSAAEMLTEIAGDQEVSLSIEAITVDVVSMDIPEAQKEVLQKAEAQGGMILDLNLVDNDGAKVIFSDSKGGSVSIEVPYEMTGEISVPVVYYVSDDGTIYEMPTIYDPLNKTIAFTTHHFSYYMVAEAGMATAEEKDPLSSTATETAAPTETTTAEVTPPTKEETQTTESPETDTSSVTAETTENTEATVLHPTVTVGDSNGDGEITAEDAALVLLYAAAQGAGMTYEDEFIDASHADTDGNGNVDAIDAANILIYAAIVGAEGKAEWADVLGTK